MFTLMPGAYTPAQINAMPHLLALSHTPDYRGLLRAMSATDSDGPFGFPGALSWLVSPLQPQDMASRMRARLDAVLPDEYRCVNRFFDGRVLPHLHACLTDAQRTAFFSIATQWWIVSHDLQWRRLECRFAERDSFSGPLVLNADQQAHMVDACYPYAVIEHFLQTAPQLLDDLPPAGRYSHFADVLRVAESFGIESGAGAILFCTLSLTRGKSFHEHEPWPTLLAQVRRGAMSLQQAVRAQHG